MSRRIRFALIAVVCTLLLSSSAYFVVHPAKPDNRPRPPFEPSVQAIPDLTLRYKRLRDARARSDDAAAQAIIADIVHFRDAALPPLESELSRLSMTGVPLTPVDEAVLKDLLSALVSIDTPASRAALVHHVAEAARGRVRAALLAEACLAILASSHALAVQALLAAFGVEPDDDAARSLVDALRTAARFDDLAAVEGAKEGLPKARQEALEAVAAEISRRALPDALAGKSVPAATRMTRAEEILFGASSQPSGNVPASAKPVLDEAKANQSTVVLPAGMGESRAAVVHWLESQGTGDTAAQATALLERAVALPPPQGDEPNAAEAAVGVLCRLAGSGGGDALKALGRLFEGGDPARRAALADQMATYATAKTSPMLSSWLEDPALPPEVAERGRKIVEALAAARPR